VALRVLAVTGEKRAAVLPDVPTAKESGLPAFVASSWNALAAPAKTPKDVIARLNAEINRIMSLQATRDAQLRAGAEVNPMTVAAFGDFLRQDIAHQAEGIRISGMKAN
jgi:tripartite-type tricarboxylate transporter receptor subunit TctC